MVAEMATSITVANKHSIAHKYGLPVFNDGDDLDHWAHEIALWQIVTDLAAEKQGPVIYLSLQGKARQACAVLTKEELNVATGVDVLIAKLKELYALDKEQAIYAAYEKFDTFERKNEMSIVEYINEFDRLYHKMLTYKIELPTSVLAYHLLKNANISPEKQQLARATITDLTYENMKRQIKAIHDIDTKSKSSTVPQAIKVEPTFNSSETLYNKSSSDRYYRPRGQFNRGRGYQRGNQRGNQRNNPISTCNACGSTNHWWRDCPERAQKSSSEVHIQLFTTEIQKCYVEQFVSETMNSALLDSGCVTTVCGENWLRCYLDTMPENDSIIREESSNQFKFGDGKVMKSNGQVNIPANIGGQNVNIITDVVQCEIPLLLSKSSMKMAETKLDFVNDNANMFGKDVKLCYTSSGHYCIPLCQKQQVINNIGNEESPVKCFLSLHDLDNKSVEEKEKIAVKLHKQFGHPLTSDKLKKLIKDAGISDAQLEECVDNVTNSCDTCNRYRKARSRPVVSFSLARDLNEFVAMDIKTYEGVKILHIIDLATRFSVAVIVTSKHKEEIVDKFFKNWISIFGSPQKILSDNGGEFNNELLREVGELLGIEVNTTAAEAPWSNGVVERHNATISNMLDKIISDTGCSIGIGVAWAVSAKNALHNSFGYSPNQLVFGRNPSLPSVLTDDPPALRDVTSSEVIASHLNALHAARKAFIQSESDEKLKRALRHKTRNASSKEFFQGDKVYYKRNKDREWRGPGTVEGSVGKQVRVKHGGSSVLVHPCSLRLVDERMCNAVTEKGKSYDVNIEVIYEDDQDVDEVVRGNEDILADQGEEANVIVEDRNSDVVEENGIASDGDLSEDGSDADIITVPKLGDRVRFIDPATNLLTEFVIISRGGKKGGVHQYWYNAKNCVDDSIKSFNFETLPEWETVNTEVILNVSNLETHSILTAKAQELDNWKTYNVYDEVIDEGQETISVRWVLSSKNVEGKTITKARLVVRGFEEDSSNIRKDSPTCCKENLLLVNCIAVSKDWKVKSLDIKAAFLQGYKIERDVFVKPPIEAGTDKLWKLKIAVYGLCDAPRAWYKKVSDEFINLGAAKSKYDDALFFWCEVNDLQGLICCHVDDFFFAGNESFDDKIIEPIKTKFKISHEEECTFKYLGLNINQDEHNIYMHQNEYIDSVNPINLDKHRESQKDSDLSTKEARLLKSLAGQLNWIATHTRPDMSYAACDINVSMKNAKIKDILRANKYVRMLQNEKVKLTFPNIGDVLKASIITFSDASFANLEDGGSQGGFITFIYGENKKCAPLVWQSRKVKRVVKSTLAAETLSLQDGAENSFMSRQVILELHNIESQVDVIPIHCFTDNKSLKDAVYSTNTIADKRLKVDICDIRDKIRNKEINSIQWVSKENQIADCFTKFGASSKRLLGVLNGEIQLLSSEFDSPT